jgi:hypothetical protein
MKNNLMRNHGSALIIAIIISLMVAILSVVGTKLITTTFLDIKQQQYLAAGADNASRAGLVDAISWFRRQTSQPVSSGYPPTKYAWSDGAFNPRFSTDTTHCDTIDESIGIVKELKLSENGNLWSRYEVARQTNPAVVPYNPDAVHDISGQKLFSGEKDGMGYVWYISSKGYIFRKKDTTKAYNISPNQVVATSRVSTEIKKISLQSYSAAVVVNDCGSDYTNRTIEVNKNGVVNGGNGSGIYGVGYFSGPADKTNKVSSSKPPYNTNDNGQVVGNPTSYIKISSAPTVGYVLGVSTADLILMSDYVVTDTSQLPETLPDMSLIYIEGNATFNSSRPLRSSGVLFVNGNLTVSQGSNCLYSGLIYVTGTATINEPALISGCLIAYKGSNISRSGASDIVEIDYDSTVLNLVRQQVCQYREIKSAYRVFTGFKD